MSNYFVSPAPSASRQMIRSGTSFCHSPLSSLETGTATVTVLRTYYYVKFVILNKRNISPDASIRIFRFSYHMWWRNFTVDTVIGDIGIQH